MFFIVSPPSSLLDVIFLKVLESSWFRFRASFVFVNGVCKAQSSDWSVNFNNYLI